MPSALPREEPCRNETSTVPSARAAIPVKALLARRAGDRAAS